MTKQHIIFQAESLHSNSSDLPSIEAAPGRYCGYFEDDNQDQYVFEYESETQKARLHIESKDGYRVHPVVNGHVTAEQLRIEVIFWITVCWMTVTGNPPLPMRINWPSEKEVAINKASRRSPSWLPPGSSGD